MTSTELVLAGPPRAFPTDGDSSFAEHHSASSFVHTSFFSMPVERAALENNKHALAADQELRKMLQDALAAASRVAAENARLEKEKKELSDQLAIVKAMAVDSGSELADPGAIEASVGALRGRLLHEARVQNDKQCQRINELEAQLASARHEIVVERAFAEHNASRLKTLDDMEALSAARARTIERLDDELVKAHIAHDNSKTEIKALQTQCRNLENEKIHVSEELDKAKADIIDLKERNDKLADRLIGQSFEMRIQRNQVSSPLQPHGQENNTPARVPLGNVPKSTTSLRSNPAINDGERVELQSKISQLERQNALLRREIELSKQVITKTTESSYSPATNSPSLVSVLKKQLLEAAEEIRYLREDRRKDIATKTALEAAWTARFKALEARLRKESISRKDLQFYKFVAKKAHAELASLKAQERLRLLADGRPLTEGSPSPVIRPKLVGSRN